MSDSAVAFGDWVRKALRERGRTQQDLAEMTGLSRQTISAAINKNQASKKTKQTIREKLGPAAAGVGRASALHEAMTPLPTGPGLCDALELDIWSNRIDAPHVVPELVARLVLGSEAELTGCRFPTGEGVRAEGWDGITGATKGAAFVPQGAAGWEIGTGKTPSAKANDDYKKRTDDPSPLGASPSTFVFVTSRRWAGGRAWAEEKLKEGEWKDVRVLDADDLVNWMRGQPAIHVWISNVIGKDTRGSHHLEQYWQKMADSTNPPLSAKFLLAGREEAAKEVRRLLDGEKSSFFIQSSMRVESVLLLYAALVAEDSAQYHPIINRTLVVETEAAFRQWSGWGQPLILVPLFDVGAHDVSTAVKAGHKVVLPAGPADRPGASGVRAPPLNLRSASGALEGAGTDHKDAWALSRLARRSMTCFLRSRAIAGALKRPGWSLPGHAHEVIPGLMAGGWMDNSEADRAFLARLADSDYKTFRTRLIAANDPNDPCFRNAKGWWYLVSYADAWQQLSPYIHEDDLRRFRDVATEVLGQVHPSLASSTLHHWSSIDKKHEALGSSDLRSGIANTLAAFGAFDGTDSPCGGRAADYARLTVRELLEKANEDWRLWAALSYHLPFLAEAAPDEFLESVQAGLRSDEAPLAKLMEAEETGVFGFAPHCGLLEALEVLAWSPDHLGLVVEVLAQLDRVDPGSPLRRTDTTTNFVTNRPFRNLRAIFRTWHRATCSTVEDRLNALDSLLEKHEDVGWGVLVSMMPKAHDVADSPRRPSFRDWTEDVPGVTFAERRQLVLGAFDRMRRLAGTNGARWGDLLDVLSELPPDMVEPVYKHLEVVDVQTLPVEDRTTIWKKLREGVARHREFADAKWAMPEAVVDRLESISKRFEPADPAVLHRWLFDDWPDLTNPKSRNRGDHDARQAEIAALRQEVLNEILAGPEAHDLLTRLMDTVGSPHALGWETARCSYGEALENWVIEFLGDESPHRSDFATGFFRQGCHDRGEGWVLEILEQKEGLTTQQKVSLLLLLAPETRTLDLVDSMGAHVSELYWTKAEVHRLAKGDVDIIWQLLVDAGRARHAVRMVSLALAWGTPTSVDTIAGTLRSYFSFPGPATMEYQSESWDLQKLVTALYDANYAPEKLAPLEWGLLAAMPYRDWKPQVLEGELGRNPGFFVDVVKAVFKRRDAEHEEEPSEQEVNRAQLAYRLLTDWRTVPGTRADGSVDEASLRAWIDEVKPQLAEAGRREIGLHQIGQVLSGSPSEPDGTWPCKAVRNVIEEVASKEMEEGIRIGIVNSRGVTRRSLDEGGAQEKTLAKKYADLASKLKVSHPRVARILRQVSQGYERDGVREDDEAARFQEIGV